MEHFFGYFVIGAFFKTGSGKEIVLWMRLGG